MFALVEHFLLQYWLKASAGVFMFWNHPVIVLYDPGLACFHHVFDLDPFLDSSKDWKKR